MTRGARICFFNTCVTTAWPLACRVGVGPDIEHDPGLVHGAPQPVLHTGDLDHDLVQVPFVADTREPAADPVGELLAKFAGPLPHALCDVDERRLAKLADEFSIRRITNSFDEVLRMDDVEIVDICTPPALHFAQILAALAAGKQVVCEKPLAGSVAEVDRVIAAEARSAGRVMPVFQ